MFFLYQHRFLLINNTIKFLFFFSLLFSVSTIHTMEKLKNEMAKYGFTFIKSTNKRPPQFYEEWIELSNDGNTISFFANESEYLKILTMYNIKTGNQMKHKYQEELPSDITLQDNIDDIFVYTQNDDSLFTLSKDGFLTRYDLLNKSVAARTKIYNRYPPQMRKMAISNDNKLIAISRFNTITILETTQFKSITSFEVELDRWDTSPIIHDIAFTLDNKYLIVCRKGYYLSLFETREILETMRLHPPLVRSKSFPNNFGPMVLSKNKKNLLIVMRNSLSIWQTPFYFWNKDEWDKLDETERIDFITKEMKNLHIDTTRSVFKQNNTTFSIPTLFMN